MSMNIYFAVNARGHLMVTTIRDTANLWTDGGRTSFEVYQLHHYRLVTVYQRGMQLSHALAVSVPAMTRWASENKMRPRDVRRVESRSYKRKQKVSDKQKRLF